MGKEDCHDFKPSPVPLLQLAEKPTVKPIECLYIGDQPTDIQATHSANMVSVAALWGEGKMERLSPLNPSFLFNSPNQLTELLLKQKTVIEGLLYMNFSYSAKGGAALIRISAFFVLKWQNT
jgi:phosphoglycolate phosphatase-like HAD superfamily hydrolase